MTAGVWRRYGPIAGDTFWRLAFRQGKPPAEMNFAVCHAVVVVSAFGLNNLLKLCIDQLAVFTVAGAITVGTTLWAFGLFLQLPHSFYEHRPPFLVLIHEGGHLVTLLILCLYHSRFVD